MDQPEEAQEEDAEDVRELQREAAVAFGKFKVAVVATFDTQDALVALKTVADNPEGFEPWLSDRIDGCYKYLTKARTARRKKPSPEAYAFEDLMVDCLTRLLSLRAQWVNLLDRFEEGSPLQAIVENLDYYR